MPWTEPECAGEGVVSQSIVALHETVVSEFILDECQAGRERGRFEDRILLTVR